MRCGSCIIIIYRLRTPRLTLGFKGSAASHKQAAASPGFALAGAARLARNRFFGSARRARNVDWSPERASLVSPSQAWLGVFRPPTAAFRCFQQIHSRREVTAGVARNNSEVTGRVARSRLASPGIIPRSRIADSRELERNPEEVSGLNGSELDSERIVTSFSRNRHRGPGGWHPPGKAELG